MHLIFFNSMLFLEGPSSSGIFPHDFHNFLHVCTIDQICHTVVMYFMFSAATT